MSFLRPTLSDLQKSAISDIVAAKLPGVSALLPNSVLRVLSYAIAGMTYLLYSYLDWISLQSIPVTATDAYLESWAGLIGITRKAATAASGAVTLTGVNGLDIPVGTGFSRSDGATFTSTADTGIGAGGSAVVQITADTAGIAGNTDAGMALSLSSTITGINNTAVVSTALVGGAETETDDALRSRMLFAFSNPPSGGSLSDYVTWAEAVPGVTRAWSQTGGKAGDGSVTVFVMLDQTEAAHNGFPQGSDGGATSELRLIRATGDQLTVANQLYPLRPATALVFVQAPVPAAVNLTFGNITGSTSAISAAVADLFLASGTPLGSSVFPSQIVAAVETVYSGAFSLLAPASAVTIPVGSLPTVGTITLT